jgi:hypothetical protein
MRAASAVLTALKSQKVVDCAYSGRIVRADPQSGPARQGFHRVADAIAARAHHRGPWNDGSGVNKARDCEVSGSESRGDVSHVATNCARRYEIGGIALQLDPSTIRQRNEEMGRAVLIDSHCALTSRLQRSKSAVVGRTVARAVRLGASDGDQRSNDCPSHW